MLRVVLDTNIFISSIFWRHGNPHKIVESALEKKFQVYTSVEILEELQDVLIRDFEESVEQSNNLIMLIANYAQLVTSAQKVSLITEDPDDNKILECALTSHAHFIVTGDRHLLKLQLFQKTHIVTPADFLKIIYYHDAEPGHGE